MKLRPAPLALLGLLFTATLPLAAQPAARGLVLDAGRAPVADARVEIFALPGLYEQGRQRLEGRAPVPLASAETDAIGRFDLPAGKPGVYQVRVSAPGKVPLTFEPLLLAAETELPPAFLPSDVGATFQLQTADGKPAAGLWVLVEGTGEEPALGGWRLAPRIARTGKDGTVTLPRLDEEELRVRTFGSGGLEDLQSTGLQRVLRIPTRPESVRKRLVRIVDEAGAAVVGALIRTGEASWPAGLTDAEGRIRLPIRGDGILRLRVVDALGRNVLHQLAPLPNRNPSASSPSPNRRGEPLEETVVLANLRPVGGRVLREEDGQPWAGALIWSPLDPGSFALSDAEGRYLTPAPQVGGTWLEVRAAGRLPRRILLDPRRLGAGRAPTFTLSPAGEIAGRVTDEKDRPLAGASLLSLPVSRDGAPLPVEGNGAVPAASTGADGTFRLRDLKPGEPSLLQATKAGFLPVALEVSIPRPGELREPILARLPPARAATGRIVDERKRPVPGARVFLFPSRGNGGKGELLARAGALAGGSAGSRLAITAPRTLSDAAGRFAVAEIPALELDLLVTCPGFAPAVLRRFRAAPGSGPVQLGEVTLRAGASLTGIVADDQGKPLAGARVYRLAEVRPPQELAAALREKPHQAMSGTDGKFRLDDLRKGEPVHLLIAAAGYLPKGVRGILPPPASPLRVVLAPGVELAGRVFDPEGRPVAGAALSLSWRATLPGRVDLRVGLPVTRSATSDRQGRFRFPEMPAGGARLAVAAPGFQPIEEIAVTLPPANGEETRVILERGATVEGRVTDSDGETVPGVRLVAGLASGLSDEAGAFQIDGVRPGPLTVEAVHPHYAKVRKRLRVEAGTNHLEVVLAAGTTVRGRVVDSKGSPVSGALALLDSAERNEAKSYSARSGSAGEVTFTAVATGSYRLRASARGYAEGEASRPVVVGREPVEGVEVALAASGAIRGRILGLAPDDLASVLLSARHESGESATAEIDALGSYAFRSLRAGAWLLEANLLEGERSARARVLLAEGGNENRNLRFGDGLTLTGHILYHDQPLAEAKVALRGQQMAVERGLTTGYDGTFRFKDLSPGSYWLGVSQTTEQVAHNEIVDLGGDRELLIDLKRQTVAGRITATEGGKPVGGALVSLRHAAGPNGAEFLIADGSAPSGTFALERVPPGHYRLTVSHEGYSPAEREIDVQPGEDSDAGEIRLQATQGGAISVRCAAGGAPNLIHLRVVSPAGAVLLAETRPVDGAGTVRLTTVPAGQWTLLAASAQCGLAVAPLAVPSESGAPLSLVLPAASRLIVRVPALQTSDAISRLTVRGSDGRALQTLEMGGSLKAEWPVVAGSATLGAVPAGSWTLSVQAPDGRSWTASVVTDGQEEAQVSLE